MKPTLLRAIPTTLAVLAVAAGATTAALALSGNPAELAGGSIAVTSVDAPADDRQASDMDDPSRDDSRLATQRDDRGRDDEVRHPTREDRPLRREVRRDGGRLETRAESLHVGTQRYAAAAAGSVAVRRDDASLTVGDVDTAPGWTSTVERSSGYEVEVTFRRDGQRIDFTAEIEHDRVKTRVRER